MDPWLLWLAAPLWTRCQWMDLRSRWQKSHVHFVLLWLEWMFHGYSMLWRWILGVLSSSSSSSSSSPLISFLGRLFAPWIHVEQKQWEACHKWEQLFREHWSPDQHRDSSYPSATSVKTFSVMYGGMMAIVLVKQSSSTSEIVRIQQGSIGTGFLGVFGNKGSVALSLEFSVNTTVDDGHSKKDRGDTTAPTTTATTTITFVNCHLPPHMGPARKQQRNRAFQQICDQLRLLYRDRVPPLSRSRSIFQSDLLIVAGDLNYRWKCTGKEEFQTIVQGDPSLSALLEWDELSAERRSNPLFRGFQEAPIDFYPTYRLSLPRAVPSHQDDKEPAHHDDHHHYHQWYSAYDWRKRVPAWCDRVLYQHRSTTKSTVHVKEYRSLDMVISGSDHQPVSLRMQWTLERAVDGDSVSYDQHNNNSNHDYHHHHYYYYWVAMAAYVACCAWGCIALVFAVYG